MMRTNGISKHWKMNELEIKNENHEKTNPKNTIWSNNKRLPANRCMFGKNS